MPAIGARMTDQEVADATNYVRAAWGNAAPATAGAGLSGELRKVTQTIMAMNLPDGCPKIADDSMSKVISSSDVQSILQKTNDENIVQNSDELIAKVKAGVPGAKQADIINSLTLGYCPVVASNTALKTQAQKSEMLDEFAERVYTQAANKGQY
jgi:hypothetical protein